MCVWASPWAESFFGVSVVAIIHVQDFLGSQLHHKGLLRNYFFPFFDKQHNRVKPEVPLAGF